MLDAFFIGTVARSSSDGSKLTFESKNSMYNIQFSLCSGNHCCMTFNCANLIYILRLPSIAQSIAEIQVTNEDKIFDFCLKRIDQEHKIFRCHRFRLNKSRVDDCNIIFQWDKVTKTPMLLNMKGMGTNVIAHCVGVFNRQIFDGFFQKSMELTQENLDLAMGDKDRVFRVVEGFFIDQHFQIKCHIWQGLHVEPNLSMMRGTLQNVQHKDQGLFVSSTWSRKRIFKQ